MVAMRKTSFQPHLAPVHRISTILTILPDFQDRGLRFAVAIHDVFEELAELTHDFFLREP
jgi:hypothetical protein